MVVPQRVRLTHSLSTAEIEQPTGFAERGQSDPLHVHSRAE